MQRQQGGGPSWGAASSAGLLPGATFVDLTSFSALVEVQRAEARAGEAGSPAPCTEQAALLTIGQRARPRLVCTAPPLLRRHPATRRRSHPRHRLPPLRPCPCRITPGMRAVAASTPAAASCFTTRRPAARRLAVAARAAPAATAAAAAPAVFHYTELQLETKPGIHIVDITPQVLEWS